MVVPTQPVCRDFMECVSSDEHQWNQMLTINTGPVMRPRRKQQPFLSSASTEKSTERPLYGRRLSLTPSKSLVRLVYFRLIAQTLPNGFPNKTGALAEAAFCIGQSHVLAELRSTGSKRNRVIKIIAIFDQTKNEKVSLEPTQELLAIMHSKMVSEYDYVRRRRVLIGGRN